MGKDGGVPTKAKGDARWRVRITRDGGRVHSIKVDLPAEGNSDDTNSLYVCILIMASILTGQGRLPGLSLAAVKNRLVKVVDVVLREVRDANLRVVMGGRAERRKKTEIAEKTEGTEGKNVATDIDLTGQVAEEKDIDKDTDKPSDG